MRCRATTPLGPLIETLLVKYQIGRNSCEQTIRDHWPEMVGAANAAYSHPVRIDRGKSLMVLVSTASFAMNSLCTANRSWARSRNSRAAITCAS